MITPKQTAILFQSSNLYTFALFTSIKTFLLHSPQLASQSDIYVYTYNWPAHIKKVFTDSFRVTLMDYQLPDFVPTSPWIDIYTPAVFARFEAFTLLKKYKQVLCIDSDVLIQKELAPVFEEVKEQLGFVLDGLPSLRNNFSATIPGYDFSRPCVNSGFIALKNPLPADTLRNWLYEMLAKHADICYLPDQALFNLMLQKFKLTPTILPKLYNLAASRPTKLLKQAYIIHSTGHRKFWAYYYYDEWYNSYAQWYKLSGQSVAIRRPPNCKAWNWLLQKTGWNKYVFFQLAPDGFRRPTKFIIFTLKRWLRIRY